MHKCKVELAVISRNLNKRKFVAERAQRKKSRVDLRELSDPRDDVRSSGYQRL